MANGCWRGMRTCSRRCRSDIVDRRIRCRIPTTFKANPPSSPGGRGIEPLLSSGPMRLWSLHPRYLDPQGLVALWREALLARAVLRGETRGYRNHPQLERFRLQPSALSAISSYLDSVHAEAVSRGYSFDRSKIGRARARAPITVSAGQVAYEWEHLMRKLAVRNPVLHERWRTSAEPECHPLFSLCPGGVERWERPLA
jgi:hypothetical protein